MDRGTMRGPRLLFADEKGVVYDHPHLLAAVRSGDEVFRSEERPVPMPEGARLCTLPGRSPVGIDPRSGELVTVGEIAVGGRTFVPQAVGATLPPGFTRTLLPAGRPARNRAVEPPGLPQWAYTAAGFGPRGPVVWALHTDRRTHWSPNRHSTPDLRRRVEKRLERSSNPVYRQLARCALEWNCFTAQNTFYGRDEGAIPSSAACNAACVGCISEQPAGRPPPSHERIRRAPTADEMAEVAAQHLGRASGRVIVSFGQGCEGEPLLRWKEIAKAIRLARGLTPRGSINVNTNGSSPRALAALCDAGLDACRISLNSASDDLYTAYYHPRGYVLGEVIASMRIAKDKGAYLALNLLTFPGVTDREGEVERLCRLVGEVQVDQVQTRPLAIDPDVYMEVARGRGAGGAPIGIPRLIEALKAAHPGLVVGNFARAREEGATARAAS